MIPTEAYRTRVRNFLRDWNKHHPLDHLWRKHFNIPFGSAEHLNATFVDQLMWIEDMEHMNKVMEEHRMIASSPNGRVKIQSSADEVILSNDEIDKHFDKMKT